MEAEFVAASEQAHELLGIRETLNEIGKPPALPMVLHVDNQAALKQLAGEASSLKAKHIDVRTKFVCDYATRDHRVAVRPLGATTRGSSDGGAGRSRARVAI